MVWCPQTCGDIVYAKTKANNLAIRENTDESRLDVMGIMKWKETIPSNFVVLFNRRRRNSTGSASHRTPSWWTCWLKLFTSCSLQQTVRPRCWLAPFWEWQSLITRSCRNSNLLTTLAWSASYWNKVLFSSFRFSAPVKTSLLPLLQTGRRMCPRTSRSAVRVSNTLLT